MGLSHSPRIVTDGLVLALDAGNIVKSAKGFKNILDLNTWTLGTGGATGFTANGTTAENERILDTNPFGVSSVIWQTPSNDIESNDDGGWNTSAFAIDNTKRYRFSTWVRKKDVIGNGRFYLGTTGYNASSTNIGVINKSGGATDTNFYFTAPRFDAELNGLVSLNEWVLAVAHIWPEGTTADSQMHPDSGIWNLSGVKRLAVGDCIWAPNTTLANHRSYQYYSTTVNEKQQWYQPRVDLCDGTEPSLQDLLSGAGSRWYDLSSNRNTGNLVNGIGYNSTNGGSFVFDGVNDYVTLPSQNDAQSPLTGYGSFNGADTNSFTLEIWIKTTQISGTSSIVAPILIGRDNNDIWANLTLFNGYVYYIHYNSAWLDNLKSTTMVSNNVWHQVVYVNNSNETGIIYIDSVNEASGSSSLSGVNYFSPDNLGLGYSGNFYQGNVGNVKFYDRSLTAQEIRQNFNALRGRYGI